MEVSMRNGALTRQRICDSALRLFVDRGVTETSVRDITAAAGITEGALYRHYESKDELAWQLFSDHYIQLARKLEQLQAAEPAFRGKVDALVGHFARVFDENPTLFAYLLLTQHNQVRKVPATMMTPPGVVRRVIAEGLAKQAGGKPAIDPSVISSMVLGLVMQVAVDRIYGRLKMDLSELSATLADACWRVIDGGAAPVKQ
jgi:AcrR family transcriptional regulator